MWLACLPKQENSELPSMKNTVVTNQSSGTYWLFIITALIQFYNTWFDLDNPFTVSVYYLMLHAKNVYALNLHQDNACYYLKDYIKFLNCLCYSMHWNGTAVPLLRLHKWHISIIKSLWVIQLECTYFILHVNWTAVTWLPTWSFSDLNTLLNTQGNFKS